MNMLAYGWGVFYCQKLGIPHNVNFVGGVGLWAGYHVLDQLGTRLPADAVCANQTPQEGAEFRKLLKIHEMGGAPAVMKHLENLARP